jgi:hypothetical protein
MKSLFPVVAAIAILVCAQASAGILFPDGRLVQWVPNAEISVPVSAAFNQNGIPVVVYSPERLGTLDLVEGKFLLLRQDYVALLARRALRSNSTPKGTFRNQATEALIEQISEQVIYRFMPPGIDHTRMLDCIAFHGLNSTEQSDLLRSLQRRGRELVVWPTNHILTADDVLSMRTRECERGLAEYK